MAATGALQPHFRRLAPLPVRPHFAGERLPFDKAAGVREKTHMRKNPHTSADAVLSRRGRQIMDIVYAGGEVSAREIWERLPGAPTYSTVRTLLAALEEKGQLVRRLVGKAFVYRPAHPRERAAASALRRLLATFFHGSVENAVSGLLQLDDASLTDAELARIARVIQQARKTKKP